MNMPPYPGQGTAIPKEMGNGDWIYLNIAFLDLDDPTTAVPGPTGQVDLEPVRKSAVRFGAAQVAAAMGISVRNLMRANRKGKLALASQPVSKPGVSSAMRFRLSFDQYFYEITSGISEDKMGSA